MAEHPKIAIVDDDESVRQSLHHLLEVSGFTALMFSSAEEFLACGLFCEIECLILDIAMRAMSGPKLQAELKRLGAKIPIIFISGELDDTLRLRLMEQGAVDCLRKPFSDTALLDALNRALQVG